MITLMMARLPASHNVFNSRLPKPFRIGSRSHRRAQEIADAGSRACCEQTQITDAGREISLAKKDRRPPSGSGETSRRVPGGPQRRRITGEHFLSACVQLCRNQVDGFTWGAGYRPIENLLQLRVWTWQRHMGRPSGTSREPARSERSFGQCLRFARNSTGLRNSENSQRGH